MRRLIARLLIAVLLLQFSWIAAAASCMHDADVNPDHFGHHVHVHKGSKADGAEKQAQSMPDGDCAVCHMGCGNFPSADMQGDTVGAPHPAPAFVTHPHPSRQSDTPERPQWASLA